MAPPSVKDIARFVAPLPYLNFLRYFKQQHPKYELRHLLQEALPYWQALCGCQKHMFEREHILLRLAHSKRSLRPKVYRKKKIYGQKKHRK